MTTDEGSKKSPEGKISENVNPLFSPGFRSVAEMAGWDEEALLIASLVVEETPDQNPKQRRRTVIVKNSGTPPASSRRKRAKAQTASPMPVAVLNLDESGCQKEEAVVSEVSGGKNEIGEPSKAKDLIDLPSSSSTSRSRSAEPPAIPCIDKLREELSCAICLEICFEPSTTPCGHSFCKKCLRSAADKCGKKCPKCRQLISNARTCTINTVLWNTIQLLFPEEVKARKKAAAIAGDTQKQTSAGKHHHHHVSRNRRIPVLINNSPERTSSRGGGGGAQRRSFGRASSSRGGDPVSAARPRRGDVVVVEEEEGDAALAMRLQREEFMRTESGGEQQQVRRGNSLALARANLRAMASRAISIRRRS